MLNLKDINKTNRSPSKCQQELDNFLTNQIAPTQKEILSEYLRYQNTFAVIFPSQSTIAQNVECSRKHVNTTTTFLHKMGLMLKVRQKGFNKPCLYRFPVELFKFDLRQILIKHFPFLKWIPLSLLLSLQSKDFLEEVTLRKRVLFIFPTPTTTQHKDNQSELRLLREGGEEGELLNKKNEKEERVEMNVYQKIKQLFNLTESGKGKLVLFTPEALQYAVDNYKKLLRTRQQIRKPYAYLFSVAKNYSLQNKLKLDWQKYYEMEEKIGWTTTTPDIEKRHQPGFDLNNEKKVNDKDIVEQINHSNLNVSDSNRLIMYNNLQVKNETLKFTPISQKIKNQKKRTLEEVIENIKNLEEMISHIGISMQNAIDNQKEFLKITLLGRLKDLESLQQELKDLST